jgi:nucleoside-diphosphate-sugar epimerase
MRDILRLPEASASLGWETGDECVFFNLAWGGVTQLSDLNVQAQLSNVISAVDALNAAYAIGCERFVHVGTMEEAFTYRYLELDHNKNSEYNRHVIYSVAKIAAKYALKLKASQLGIDFIYVLHSHVMAPDDDKDSFLQVTLGKLINGEELIFSTGEQLFDVVSASDCVRGYALICEKGLPGKEYWVGSGNPKPLREYVERMYNLYPSGIEMQFGKLPYNDVKLTEEDFSIAELENDTGYAPRLTYEDIVRELHDSLTRR